MNRLWIAAVFTLLACNQNKADNTAPQSSASTEPSSVVKTKPIAEVNMSASAAPSAAQTLGYTGSFKAQARKPSTTKKEGAPQAWEKDDGTAFSGEGKITLAVAPDGTVRGNLSGAFGDRVLRGKLSGDELRAALVPAGTDITQIQNGTLTLKRDGNAFKGKLTAATGDALILREAEVQVTPSAS